MTRPSPRPRRPDSSSSATSTKVSSISRCRTRPSPAVTTATASAPAPPRCFVSPCRTTSRPPSASFANNCLSQIRRGRPTNGGAWDWAASGDDTLLAGELAEAGLDALEALAEGGLGEADDLGDLAPGEVAIDAEDEHHLIFGVELLAEADDGLLDLGAEVDGGGGADLLHQGVDGRAGQGDETGVALVAERQDPVARDDVDPGAQRRFPAEGREIAPDV